MTGLNHHASMRSDSPNFWSEPLPRAEARTPGAEAWAAGGAALDHLRLESAATGPPARVRKAAISAGGSLAPGFSRHQPENGQEVAGADCSGDAVGPEVASPSTDPY